MSEEIYLFITQQILTSVTGVFYKGLEKKLTNENYRKARQEYKQQMQLYHKGELAIRPDFKEIYLSYKHTTPSPNTIYDDTFEKPYSKKSS